MTDANYLRETASLLQTDGFHYGVAVELRRIASMLDAVPPETLVALKAGTWVAVPVEPTDKMQWAGNNVGLVGYDTKGCPIIYSAMLTAAPKKPGE